MPTQVSETVLLMEKEEQVRDLVMRNLTKAGYRVITASSGKEALELYARSGGGIALMVLDLIVPEMGGNECLHGVLGLNPTVKVVIAGGHSADGPIKETPSSRAGGFVNKPSDRRRTLSVVGTVLDAE